MAKHDYKFYGGKFDKIRIRGDPRHAREIMIEKMGLEPTDIKPVYNNDRASHGAAKEFKIEGASIRRKIDNCQQSV